jgi:rRNA maturation endonuclease Nob1
MCRQNKLKFNLSLSLKNMHFDLAYPSNGNQPIKNVYGWVSKCAKWPTHDNFIQHHHCDQCGSSENKNVTH